MVKNWVALFPGQGAQHVGMGKSLFTDFSVAREAFEEASDAISANLKKLCFDGPESDLTLTENTQPCLLVTSIAAFRVAEKELGFKPALTAGHSLGEYSALVAAGALKLSDAARFVRIRGRAMQEAVPAGVGSMAALLGMEDEACERLCKEATESAKASFGLNQGVEPANYNAPGQLVIAGTKEAVDAAVALVKAGGSYSGKALPLAVSAPFHCSLMKPAKEKMIETFNGAAKPGFLHCPYVPNRTARITKESGVIFDLLIEQIDQAVLWKQSVVQILNAEFERAVEFGPGKVLQGLCKRIEQSGKKLTVSSLGDSAQFKALEAELKT